jgi:hypothetical protein
LAEVDGVEGMEMSASVLGYDDDDDDDDGSIDYTSLLDDPMDTTEKDWRKPSRQTVAKNVVATMDSFKPEPERRVKRSASTNERMGVSLSVVTDVALPEETEEITAASRRASLAQLRWLQ